MKRKHKKALSIVAIVVGSLLFCWGVYQNQTLPPEVGISHPDWWERSEERNDQEFNSFLCMGIGGFAIVTAGGELMRQARKLKV